VSKTVTEDRHGGTLIVAEGCAGTEFSFPKRSAAPCALGAICNLRRRIGSTTVAVIGSQPNDSFDFDRLQALALERRRAVRYQLEVPVVFLWENSNGNKLQAVGVTRDISEVGAFIFTNDCPAVGSHVRIEVMLIAQPGMARAILKSSMRVVRVGAGPEKFGGQGFALTGNTFSLRTAER